MAGATWIETPKKTQEPQGSLWLGAQARPVEEPAESRRRENRPSGLMRGGARRSLALRLSTRPLRLLYSRGVSPRRSWPWRPRSGRRRWSSKRLKGDIIWFKLALIFRSWRRASPARPRQPTSRCRANPRPGIEFRWSASSSPASIQRMRTMNRRAEHMKNKFLPAPPHC